MNDIHKDLELLEKMSTGLDWTDILEIARFIALVDQIKNSLKYLPNSHMSKEIQYIIHNTGELVNATHENKEVLSFKIHMKVLNLKKIFCQTYTPTLALENNDLVSK